MKFETDSETDKQRGGNKSFMDELGVTAVDIDEMVAENPSLRSFIAGYTAELMLSRTIKDQYQDLLHDLGKPDDHDRDRKGDRHYVFDGKLVRIESKSLQTASLKFDADGVPVSGKFQCDASDSREVRLSDGSTLRTTCLKVGEFDIVAVNLFGFFSQWRFAYAANEDLPRSKSHKYTKTQKAELLSTNVSITPELKAPFTWDLTGLVRRLAAEGKLQHVA